MSTFILPWLPPNINANHQYLHGGRGVRLRPEIRAWRDEVAIIVRQGEPLPDGSLIVSIDLAAPDRKRRDIDGTIKPILDAIFLAASRDDADVDGLSVMRLDPTKGGRIVVGIRAGLRKRGDA